MAMRIILLLSLAWLIGLTAPFFTVFNIGISGRDIILLIGGLFLLGKSTFEIHEKLEGEEGHASSKVRAQFRNVIVQIMLLDIVFSLDSVITAVGMADEVAVMISAVIIAVIIMMLSVNVISDFISDHPTIKILALSFLLLIGFSLVVEGLHQEIPKGYIYFAMGFSIFVEFLNLRMRQKTKKPIELREAYVPVEDPKKPK
jgi:predicted tellurium resistance membrane protein TerC